MSELKVTFKLDGVAEEAAKAYKTIQDAFKSRKVSFSEWLEAGGETESKAKQAGKKTGKKVMEGIEEGMKDESKRYQRVLEKMANEGEKKAKALTSGLFSYKAGKPTPNVIQGLKEVTGKDLAKVLGLPDINEIQAGTIKGLKEPSGADVSKILGLPDINEIQAGTIKGLKEPSGKELAKVLALGDINDIIRKDAEAANVMAESMDDLSKRGSQSMIDMQAAIAMADAKINSDIEKNIELGKKEAKSYEERAKKAEEAAKRKKAAAESAATADKASFLKNISLLAGPVFNPGGALSTMFAARQTFSALMTQTGQTGLGKAGMGQGIGAAAAGTIGLTAGATAVGFALKALQKTVEEMMKSFQHAKDLYAKSLTSGLGAGFVAKRENLAAVLGVSEQDVMKFGAAIAYINPKIENATKIFKDTLGPLTELQWDINILKINFMAFASDLGSKLAPAFKTVISQLGFLIKLASETEVLYYIFQLLIGAFKGIEIAIGSLVLGFQLIGDTFTFLIHNIINLLASIPGAKKLGIHKIDTSNDFSGSIAGADALNKLMLGSGKSLNGIPLPESHMKQLPASTWEKMGLVVGSGGQGTNDLIRKSNGYLKSIADHVKAVGSVPRSFGLDPKTANP